MKYFDKTFFRFLFGFMVLILLGLVFVSKVEAALVNINTASLTELDTLPGVGPATAQSIINARPYASVQEISRADGIGEAGSPSYENIINLITVGEIEVETEEEEGEETVSESSSSSSSAKKEEKVVPLKVSIAGSKQSVVNARGAFSAEANLKHLKKGDYLWSFGDGSTGFGREIEHTYLYPAEYIVVLRVRSRGSEAVARANVKVVPDTLRITSATPERIEIENHGSAEIDLAGRAIMSQGKVFEFPPDTIIKGGQKISFHRAVTGLDGTGARVIIAGEELPRVSDADRTKAAEIEAEILSLQRKQIEIRKTDIQQLAAPIVAASTTPSRNIDESEKSWFKTFKKFFGFR